MLIKTENLTYTYMIGTPFEKKALDNINININKGEYIGLIGHTGSGKSTLIQHFNCLLKATSGKVYIDNIDVKDKKVNLKDIRKKIGLVFQYPEHQLFEETVYKDIAYGPINMGLDNETIDKRVHEALDIVGLEKELLYVSPFELSGGQKRRVAIAGVLALKPEVLILDEPTAGLDPAGRDEILGQIDRLYHDLNLTVILVTHSMEEIAEHVDRLIVMNKGKIFMDGNVTSIFKKHDLLEDIGLSAPQITYVIKKLKEKGLCLNEDIFTVEDAVEEISKLLLMKKSEGTND